MHASALHRERTPTAPDLHRADQTSLPCPAVIHIAQHDREVDLLPLSDAAALRRRDIEIVILLYGAAIAIEVGLDRLHHEEKSCRETICSGEIRPHGMTAIIASRETTEMIAIGEDMAMLVRTDAHRSRAIGIVVRSR